MGTKNAYKMFFENLEGRNRFGDRKILKCISGCEDM